MTSARGITTHCGTPPLPQVTVGEVEKNHKAEVSRLISELASAGSAELGIKLDDGCVERLLAYGRSVAHFPTAVKVRRCGLGGGSGPGMLSPRVVPSVGERTEPASVHFSRGLCFHKASPSLLCPAGVPLEEWVVLRHQQEDAGGRQPRPHALPLCPAGRGQGGLKRSPFSRGELGTEWASIYSLFRGMLEEHMHSDTCLALPPTISRMSPC